MGRLSTEEIAGILERVDKVSAGRADVAAAEATQTAKQEKVDALVVEKEGADSELSEATTAVASAEEALTTIEAEFKEYLDEAFAS